MSRRYGSRYESYWPVYVSVAERRAKAEREMKKLQKKGKNIQPVTIEGRTIARTFWGKGWCNHLESFGDYSNRLPRGRSYVRNGSVCHLEIARGRVEAQVAGSSLYRVKADIQPLAPAKWAAIKRRCAGRVGSLIELLQGKLSDEIMSAVTDRENGLFPLPGEIKYTCNCPDWADMCKHVSAVMYGVGSRLDEQPDVLFLLRGVDHGDLISEDAAVAETLAGKGARRSRRRTVADADLAKVFGVELEDETQAEAGEEYGAHQPAVATSTRKTGKLGKPDATTKPVPKTISKRKRATRGDAPRKRVLFKPTGKSVAKLRKHLAMSVAEFARAVGVSPASVKNWERSKGAIRPHAKSLAGLQRLHDGGIILPS